MCHVESSDVWNIKVWLVVLNCNLKWFGYKFNVYVPFIATLIKSENPYVKSVIASENACIL